MRKTVLIVAILAFVCCLINLAAAATIAGKTAPDNTTEIQCDLPGNLQKKNIASRGLGCCVFRSLDHAAHWQNLPALYDFPEWMVSKNIPGGGYPDKVNALIPKIATDRKLDTPGFIQVEDNDLEILRLACRTGRMPCITYSFSPAKRYPGRIAHMVNLVGAGIGKGPDGKGWWVILDNNFPQTYEWMSENEFRRTYTGGRTGWSVILLSAPPPPVPVN